MHGARGGAPKGNAHNLKHGRETGAAKAERKRVSALLKASRATVADMLGACRHV